MTDESRVGLFGNAVTSIVTPKSVVWKAPNRLDLDLGNDTTMSYELLKGAVEYLHKQIDIKLPTSKELYKKSEDIWKQLKDRQLEKCLDKVRDEEKFSLTKPTVVYLALSQGEIVDIQDFRYESSVEDFKDKHQKFVIDFTTDNSARKWYQDGKNGLIKYIFYDKNTDFANDDYVPILLVELNHQKSIYKVYTGVLIYKTFTLLPSLSCDLDCDRLYDFILHFDMEDMLNHSKEKAAELYEAYLGFQKNPIEISVRELTTLLKRVGYDIKPHNEEQICPIDKLSDEHNNQRVQDFYNKFRFVTGENVVDLMKLSDFRKTFRYNKLTILDILDILSKEYLTYEGAKITVEVLGDIMYKLYDTNNTDKAQVLTIEKELED